MHVSRWTGVFALLLACSFTGCSGGDSTSAPESNSGGDATTAGNAGSNAPPEKTDAELLAGISIPPEKAQTPRDVVNAFLGAVRDGNTANSGPAGEALLTHKAIVANRRAGTDFSPPGNPGAQFQVVEQELLNNETAAHVLTRWTDEQGNAASDMDIIWVLKKEPEVGWGVAGALFKPFPDLDPAALDFEDPDDFQKTITWIEQESIRRAQMASLDGPPINRQPPPGTDGSGQQPPAGLNNGADIR